MEALALHHPDSRPMRIDEIAAKEAIPANYLVQILIELKADGLIQSRRGKAGGYVLARQPKEITVGDVLRAIQGDVLEMPMLHESRCPEEIKRAWRRIKVAAESAADRITFEEICAEANGKMPMYYI
jgi:Rrf2 family protein